MKSKCLLWKTGVIYNLLWYKRKKIILEIKWSRFASHVLHVCSILTLYYLTIPKALCCLIKYAVISVYASSVFFISESLNVCAIACTLWAISFFDNVSPRGPVMQTVWLQGEVLLLWLCSMQLQSSVRDRSRWHCPVSDMIQISYLWVPAIENDKCSCLERERVCFVQEYLIFMQVKAVS